MHEEEWKKKNGKTSVKSDKRQQAYITSAKSVIINEIRDE